MYRFGLGRQIVGKARKPERRRSPDRSSVGLGLALEETRHPRSSARAISYLRKRRCKWGVRRFSFRFPGARRSRDERSTEGFFPAEPNRGAEYRPRVKRVATTGLLLFRERRASRGRACLATWKIVRNDSRGETKTAPTSTSPTVRLLFRVSGTPLFRFDLFAASSRFHGLETVVTGPSDEKPGSLNCFLDRSWTG